jgi:hypothetical protein
MANCGDMPATLLEIAASALMKNANGDVYFNAVYYTGGTETSAIACADNISDLEAFIVANGFTVDANGKVAIKLRNPV